MTDVANPNFIAQSTTGSPSQIEDGIDFPHTGLLKALHTASSGRYAISGFNITNTSATTLVVAGGKINYHGNIVDVTGATVPLSATHTNGYHLLVAPEPTGANDDSVVTVRNPVAINKVAAYTARDTIIAVITHTGSANPHIQYLTHDKTENSLSIAHNNSNDTYTEAATMKVTATGVDIVSSHAALTVQNTVGDANIIFRGKDNTQVIDALTLDMSENGNAIFTGSVSAAGNVLTKNTISNNANNRILTATAVTDEHNAEAGLEYDGNLNVLAGSIQVTNGSITTNGLITTTANNITAPAGSVSAVSIGGGTGGISNMGAKTKSVALAADARGGNYTPENTTMTPNIVAAMGNPLSLHREHYFVGIDSSPQATSASHSNGTVHSMAVARTDDLLIMMQRNEQNRAANNATSATYLPMETFGGYAGFIALPDPKSHEGKRVTITNISSFGLYVCVTDATLDPSVQALKNRMNGGYQPTVNSTGADKALNQMNNIITGLTGLNTFGNTRCVDLSRILLVGATPSAILPSLSYTGGTSMDACLIKPRESVTFVGYAQPAQEAGSNFKDDVAFQQGLFHEQAQAAGTGSYGQWFIEGSSSGGGFSNVAKILNEHLHIPIHLTGTSFYCSGTNTLVLPNAPPIGTQYAVLSFSGTTTVNCAANNSMSNAGHSIGPVDTMNELDIGSPTSNTTVTAGNGKTFVYVADLIWEVIG